MVSFCRGAQMNKSIKPYNLYIFIAGIFALLSFVLFVAEPNKLIEVSAVGELKKLFCDFMIHVSYSKDLSTVYDASVHACFPPLIYLFYHTVSLMLPTEEYMVGIGLYDAYYNYCVIYLVLIFVLFAVVCRRFLNNAGEKSYLAFILLMVLSSSFSFGVIQCANIVILPMILLLISVDFRESDSKLKQELALIFIAIAAAIKVYPAVFGLVYLLEKKHAQAIRLIVYGILFFCVPFAFTGGVNGFKNFINNSLSVQATWYDCSPNGVYANVINIFDNSILATVITVIVLLVVMLMLFLVQDAWKRYFLCCFIMVMIPLWSGAYTPIFFVIPFLCLVKNTDVINTKFDLIYFVLFSVLFTSSCFDFQVSSIKVFVTSILMLIILIFQQVLSYRSKNRLKNSLE